MRNSVPEVCADMSPAFQKGIQKQFPIAKLTFDKFHVIKLINEAVDKVRREEQSTEGVLKKSRYIWLSNPENLNKMQSNKLNKMNTMNLKTGRAYQIKLSLQSIYKDPENITQATLLSKKGYS